MNAMQESIKRPLVDDLLEQGLEFYGQNRIADAIQCWQQVLAQVPGEQRAMDYLESAGASPLSGYQEPSVSSRVAPDSEASPPSEFPHMTLQELEDAALDREAFERMLRERRYEDALAFLYKERERAPHDSSISRGIRVLKDHLFARYARALGSLDWTPVVMADDDGLRALTFEQRTILRLVDGLATFGDIVGSSRLGRLETCRQLVVMLRRGAIGVGTTAPSSIPSSLGEQGPPSPPPPASEPPQTLRPSPVIFSPPTLPPPPSISPTVPMSVRPVGEQAPYAVRLERATEAYLRRDYDEAERLYETCAEERPDDRRVGYNLRKLRERKGNAST